MADCRNELWMEKGGSICTVQLYEFRSEFSPNKTVYKIPKWIVFNVGKDAANHIVKLHNDHIHRMETLKKMGLE